MLVFHWCAWPIFILAYALGSVPFAIVVSKIMQLPDPRTQGSGNPGATNMLRIGGGKSAILTLLGDALKGFLAVYIAQLLGMQDIERSLVAFFVLLGHVFPVFFKFQGGKGVATGLGALLGLSPLLGILVLLTWIAIAALCRYSSLAAIIGCLFAPFYAILFTSHPNYFLSLLMIAVLIIIRHRHNIQRLLKGEESKISFS